MGFSRAGTFRHVLFPAAFPVILTGLRIGFFICFASVLGGETISSVSGVGRNIARKRAMEMLLTGEAIDAHTALAWGLVNRVVPADGLDAAVAHYANIIAARSARVIALGNWKWATFAFLTLFFVVTTILPHSYRFCRRCHFS